MRLPKLSFASCVAVVLAVTFTVALAAQEKEGKKGPNPFAGPFTNLKFLKPEQVQPVMMAARRGFGQACSYCHVQGQWADDSNPKKATGLMMMQMVAEINAKFPDGKQHVTCYTCHRGEVEPAMRAPEAAPKQ
jgi:Photosynthetic reaction centre cytochrome C subunit